MTLRPTWQRSERRRSERSQCGWRVFWGNSSNGPRSEATALDASESGMFIRVTSGLNQLSIGDPMILWVHPPSASGPILVKGRVRWKAMTPSPGVGVEFDEPSQRIGAALEDERATADFGGVEVTREMRAAGAGPATGAADPHLVVLRGNMTGKSFPIRGEVVIGRVSDAHICLKSDPEVSRRHARLTIREDGVCWLEDLGSRNGTFVNGIKIDESVLHNGDRVQIGAGTIFKFSEDDAWEAVLRESQKMEAVGRLAGGIAHDFNNLLTVIAGSAELLEASVRSNEKALSTVRAISHAAERAAEMTRQLLGFARRGKVKEEPVDLANMVDTVAELCRRTFPRSLTLGTAPQKGAVALADPTQIEQVLLNMCLNSRDAGATHIEIGAERVELGIDDPILPRTGLSAGPYARLMVRDNGSGMAQEVADRVFEPYFTTKERGKGTGLGMAMAYGIARNHGGAITLESKVGGGTTFYVYLPATTPRAAAEAVEAAQETQAGWHTCILVVDDDPSVREITSSLVKTLGHEVLQAEDGTQALELYRKRGSDIGCVLLDLMMPGISGEETLRQLRLQNPQVPVIICSGYNGEQVIREAGVPVLQKPFRLRELARTLNTVIQQPTVN